MTVDEAKEEFDLRLRERGLHLALDHFDMNSDGDWFSLDRIEIVRERRNSGHADQVLALLEEFCDEFRINIKITLKPLDSTTDLKRLKKLYARHGFVDARGGCLERRFHRAS